MTDPIPPADDSNERKRKLFNTTTWSVVISAQNTLSPESRAALNQLFATYWPAIYVLARQSGRSHHEAQDLTQGYFSAFFEKRWLDGVDPAKGRFRSFLCVTFRHFMQNDWNSVTALKRGGGTEILSLDFETSEKQFQLEPTDGVTPETMFDRQWARSLLENTYAALQTEKASRGEAQEFALLKPLLLPRSDGPSHASVARELNLGEKAVTMRIQRLRQRFGVLLRLEIGRTVENPAEIDDEIRHLFKVLGA